MKSEREILHINTDDFFASALRLRDATLRGKAVVVALPSSRGAVVSASYEARSEGVKRGMAVSTARRLARRAVFVPPDWDFFGKVSSEVFGVVRRYSPVVEQTSLDEGYIDYTGCDRLFGHVLDAGRRIKEDVAAETGLALSLGVASNKLVSHVASKRAKREHLVDVYPGYEREFLSTVPIDRFPLVDDRRASMLRELGIRFVGDILLFPEELLAACFGPWGRRLHAGALGEDATPVRVRPPRGKSLEASETLEPDRVSRTLLESALYRVSMRIGEGLRNERLLAALLELKLRYSDGAVVRGSAGLDAPASDDYAVFEPLLGVLMRIFTRRVRVRELVARVVRTEPAPVQFELFDAADGGSKRQGRLMSVLDGLRKRFPPGVAPAFGRAIRG